MALEPSKQPRRTESAQTPAPAPATTPELKGVPARTTALFRPIDWLSLLLTTLFVFIGYFYTLAPDMTLQDSGELSVASMYAGVPHPPGYPVWTIYTWIFTKIIPFGNMAWRVGISSAFAGALTCGLIALMVSRGGSMLVESIVEFRTITRRMENWICLVTGFVSGMLIGFNGFMWSQSIIVEVYALTMLSLVGVLLFLLRWTHNPTQYRYLYLAWFLCGIAFNNHQSLLVITVAMEILMLCVQPKLGRVMCFWNSLLFLVGLILHSKGSISILAGNTPVMVIFCFVGLASIAGWIVLSIKAKARGGDFIMDGILAGGGLLGAMVGGTKGFVVVVGLELLVFAGIDIFFASGKQIAPWTAHWRKAMGSGIAFAFGAAFYLYMPLASMTNPPLNWGYPRTVAGFIHAFTRGQYERIHPTSGQGDNIITQTANYVTRYAQQTWFILIEGPIEEFNLVYVLIGFVPLFFFRRLQARERAWLIGLVAFYFVLGPFLLELFNPAPDRQSLSLNKPFFIASHVIIAMAIGYGLTLLVAELITAYNRFRLPVMIGLACVAGYALFNVYHVYETTPYNVLRWTAIIGFGIALLAVLCIVFARNRAPAAALLAVFALMPLWPMFGHWSENEQRDHFFGYWFGHDMFTPPFKDKQGKLSYDKKEREELMRTPEGQKFIYPEMTKDTILFGGTDPGRFCPTYMIFCESFTDAKDKPRDPAFDRRDVYIITQNALADGTYLQYIRAHFYRSDEYKYDAPFFQELMRSEKERENNFKTNFLARAIAVPLDNFFGKTIGDNIEKERRAGSSFLKPDHFTDLAAFTKKIEQGGGPAEVSKYLRDNLSERTRKMLGTPNKELASSLAQDLNKLLNDELDGTQTLAALKSQLAGASAKDTPELSKKVEFYSKIVPFYTPARFQGVTISPYLQTFLQENPQYHSRIRMNRLLLEAAYPEIAKSLGGVYPDQEIYTPTPEDSQRCFQEYMADAQGRMAKGQLKPGEDVRVQDGKVQVSGQVAVMAINGLLTKVIFDKNPDHEFFVEESFPLEWMYPHLTPFGIIMKINREQLKELTQEIVDRDHHFWSEYSQRLIGNWITYDTPVSNIVAFAERVYLRKDFSNFKGDPRFVRDDDGQKAFSKLRSSIAGLYAERLRTARSAPESDRMFKEAEFSFKQAYAFCPYSPEALYRYVNLLAGVRRFEDALMLAQTSRKLDPGNTQLDRLVEELKRLKETAGGSAPAVNPALQKTEADYKANKSNFGLAVAFAQEAAKAGDVARVLGVADDIIANPKADATMIQFAMQIYAQPQIHDYAKLELALKRWTTLNPGPESWLDLAGAQGMQNKNADAVESLKQALALSAARMKADPKASNIVGAIESDPRLGGVRATPEYRVLLATNKEVPVGKP